MRGLDPRIQTARACVLDGRVKPGHEEHHFAIFDIFFVMRIGMNQQSLFKLLVAHAIMTILATPAFAQERTYRAGSIAVEAPWSRETPGGAKVAGGYMKITNTGSAPDRLVGGSVPFAGDFEIHEMSMTDGIMKMRELTKGLEIAPGATVELKPGSYHVMFVGLKSGLKQGQTVKGTLVFEKAGTIAIEYQVAPIGASSPGAAHGASHGDAKQPAMKQGH
jgi:copper(I)-binding protein